MLAVRLKGAHCPRALSRTCVRWDVGYPLSSRQGEALRQERGVFGDHPTVDRWVVQDSP